MTKTPALCHSFGRHYLGLLVWSTTLPQPTIHRRMGKRNVFIGQWNKYFGVLSPPLRRRIGIWFFRLLSLHLTVPVALPLVILQRLWPMVESLSCLWKLLFGMLWMGLFSPWWTVWQRCSKLSLLCTRPWQNWLSIWLRMPTVLVMLLM